MGGRPLLFCGVDSADSELSNENKMQMTPEFESKLIVADRHLGANTDAIREADTTPLYRTPGGFFSFLPLWSPWRPGLPSSLGF